jgi:hypothetical protein
VARRFSRTKQERADHINTVHLAKINVSVKGTHRTKQRFLRDRRNNEQIPIALTDSLPNGVVEKEGATSKASDLPPNSLTKIPSAIPCEPLSQKKGQIPM